MPRVNWDRYFMPGLAALLAVCILLLIGPAIAGKVDVGPFRVSYGDIISACGFLLTAAIVLSQVRSLAETSRSAHYSQLDAMYLDILKMAVERPRLLKPHELSDSCGTEYQTYAYVVWNFIETVRDRCGEDETLRTIWAPVIAAEHNTHCAWFYAETSPYCNKTAPKFRIEFVDFIRNEVSRNGALACGNPLLKDGAWILRPWRERARDVIVGDPRNTWLHRYEGKHWAEGSEVPSA